MGRADCDCEIQSTPREQQLAHGCCRSQRSFLERQSWHDTGSWRGRLTAMKDEDWEFGKSAGAPGGRRALSSHHPHHPHHPPPPTTTTVMTQSSETSSRALLVLLGAFLALFCSVGFLNSFGVFQDYYMSHQLSDYSEFQVSWLGSFPICIMYILSPLAGILVDRIGAPILIFGGGIGTLLAVFMTSLSYEYYQFFLAQAFLLGASMTFVFCPAVATVSKYFHKNRGLALGIAIAGSSTGGIIWPIVLDQLLNHDGVSFGWTLRIIGFIMLPLLVICLTTVRPPLEPPQPPSTDEDEKTPSEPKKQKIDISIIKNPTFLLLSAGLAICYLGMFSPFFYVTSYSRSLGMSTSLSFYMVSVVNAASLFGRVLPGFLADRYGHFNLCAAAALTSGITALCWTAAKNEAGVIVWSLFYGFTSGAIMSLQTACVARIATKETQGTAVGFFMGLLALTALFGTPISGQLAGSYGYLALSLYSGATLIAGSLLIIWARLRLERNLFAAKAELSQMMRLDVDQRQYL
ncbi:uncharacterized protein K452DRAFT_361443 [Aplosporella prunicola CBS 121167]|uniref:Major facilitator superfamily (MFS) profile domain-containing protein n=1 Tax=Aplosporella prunicola CBS 121167 TaxID=1176127 RepID=A0A6A6B5Z4_9PEZI|nr:uncharacterized protein K452DRAFT_361443 [Aplosporella prunicola CBS 121167]KAF2138397.1 hypothetical protein K452DRAFT_361443 [Aplosporella prunicola CBS 121167]